MVEGLAKKSQPDRNWQIRFRLRRLGLSVPGVMPLDTFGQEPLATALAAAGESRAAALGFHACPKTVLAFARSFRWLIGAFHKAEKWVRRDWGAITVGIG